MTPFTLSKHDYRNLDIDLGATEATQYEQRAVAIANQLEEAEGWINREGLYADYLEGLEGIAYALNSAIALIKEQEDEVEMQYEGHLDVWGHPDYVTDGSVYAAALDAKCANVVGCVLTFEELAEMLGRPELAGREEDPEAVKAFIADLLASRSPATQTL